MSSRRLSLRLAQLAHDALAELAVRLCSEGPALQAVAEKCLAASGSTPALRVTRARSMSSSRLSLRLAQLPHDVLAVLAARLCSESLALQAIADECLAAHAPLSLDLVERTLLSPDLVPSILGPLEAEDGAAAAVCTQWLVGWQATNEPPWPRRRLKQVPLDLPEEIDTRSYLEMAATLDGRLVVREGPTVHILDRSMRVLQRVARVWNSGRVIAADDDSIFSIADDTTLRRVTYDGTIVAQFELQGYQFLHGVLSPCGLLFSVLFDREVGGAGEDEIVALDAKTLQLRHRFGLGSLNDAQQLAVAGDELYVCDTNDHRLQKSSLSLGSTAARSRGRGGRRCTFVVQRTASTSSRKNTCTAATTTTTTRTRCNDTGSLCCRCRAISCRSSRTQRSPQQSSHRSAASMASCWHPTGTWKQACHHALSRQCSRCRGCSAYNRTFCLPHSHETE